MNFEKVLTAYKGCDFDEKSRTLTLDEKEIYKAVELTHEEGGELLLDITITDYLDYVTPQPSRFALIYIIRHKGFKDFIILKSFLSEAKCLSVSHIYKAANWLEREAYDQYGIVFENHPNLLTAFSIQHSH